MERRSRGRSRVRIAAAVVGTLAVAAVVGNSVLAATSVKPYVEPVGGGYDIRPLFSVDDKVPLLGGAAGEQYRMVGIPDGMGAHPNGHGTSTLFMNHELNFTLGERVGAGSKRARQRQALRLPLVRRRS